MAGRPGTVLLACGCKGCAAGGPAAARMLPCDARHGLPTRPRAPTPTTPTSCSELEAVTAQRRELEEKEARRRRQAEEQAVRQRQREERAKRALLEQEQAAAQAATPPEDLTASAAACVESEEGGAGANAAPSDAIEPSPAGVQEPAPQGGAKPSAAAKPKRQMTLASFMTSSQPRAAAAKGSGPTDAHCMDLSKPQLAGEEALSHA